ncbi:Lachesin [Trachymyrmex septentrionalis]|uniref:Lachesin n=1 Tax=Trachymyrmex septentrionalis TaxID=34720 RepID=A0A195FU83_9HYME|nr:Lachesin [Trachymyrmex septentrionalis]
MHRRVILALICVFLQTVAAQRSPTISYTSQEQIKDIGETVELVCSVQYAQDYPVLWIKFNKDSANEQVALSTGTALIIRDSRFALKHDIASSSYTLQIKDIQETDAGRYQCRIQISVSNLVSAEVELSVRRQPIISDNSTQSLVVSEGQPVVLECYANGFPPPRISWRRENNAILPTGGSIYRGNTLKISAIRKEDRGTYYCIAENGVGRGARRNINVEVEFAPVITAPRPRLGQALQYDMDLECHVEAYPPPAIIWLKDNVQLSNNQHYSISHFATADEYTDTTIRVITIEKRQYGEYICRAANKLGTVETKVELFESIIPVCPPACGQAHQGTGVVPVSSGPLVILVLLSTMLMRGKSMLLHKMALCNHQFYCYCNNGVKPKSEL